MVKRKAVLSVTVEFDDEHTTPERLRRAFKDAVQFSSNDYFDGHGVLAFGDFEPASPQTYLLDVATGLVRTIPNIKPPGICAVRDCGRTGVAATCPYDGSSHGHGRVHYECHKRWVPWTELAFEDLAVGGWRLICQEHLDQMNSEIQQEQAQRAKRSTT